MDHPPITKAIADTWLLHELKNNYLAGVIQASPSLVAYPKALAAMTDFAYNFGVARYRSSTLRKRINVQDWDGAKIELMKWVRGGKKILPGLVRRRKAEAALL